MYLDKGYPVVYCRAIILWVVLWGFSPQVMKYSLDYSLLYHEKFGVKIISGTFC